MYVPGDSQPPVRPSRLLDPIAQGFPIHIPRSATRNSPGYALYLAVVLLCVAGILFSITIASTSRLTVETVQTMQAFQARLLAESGLERAEYFYNGGDNHDLNWETPGLDEEVPGYGSIHLVCERSGAFSRILSRGVRGKAIEEAVGLAGRDLPATMEATVSLTGRIGGLVLDEGSVVDPPVALHHGSVRQGKQRRPIRGSDQWTILKELPQMPFDITPLKEEMEKRAAQRTTALAVGNALKGSVRVTRLNDSLLKQLPLAVDGDCELSGVSAAGVTVAVEGLLTIHPDTRCSASVFLAERIEVLGGRTTGCLFFAEGAVRVAGGVHASQFLGRDTIALQAEARFGSATLWLCQRTVKGDTARGVITLAPGGTYVGHAISFGDSASDTIGLREDLTVELGPRATLLGTIVSDGVIGLSNATIRGRLWARSTVAYKERIPYKNWLFGSRIIQDNQGPAFPLVGESPVRVELTRW